MKPPEDRSELAINKADAAGGDVIVTLGPSSEDGAPGHGKLRWVPSRFIIYISPGRVAACHVCMACGEARRAICVWAFGFDCESASPQSDQGPGSTSMHFQ